MGWGRVGSLQVGLSDIIYSLIMSSVFSFFFSFSLSPLPFLYGRIGIIFLPLQEKRSGYQQSVASVRDQECQEKVFFFVLLKRKVFFLFFLLNGLE